MSGKRPPPNRPDLQIADLDRRLGIMERRNQSQAAGTVGVTDHGALTGLGDDDHAQYTTNTEAISLADTEITTHAALPNAHHNRDHSIIGTTHTSFPGGTTDFLRADGTFATPAAGGGRYSLSVATKTAAYTLTGSDDLVLGDVSGGAFTLTLPTAVGATGRIYYIKKIDSSANFLTVGTTSSQTIDGQTTRVLAAQWSELTVVSDNANWLVI